jgi:hypothetical protein
MVNVSQTISHMRTSPSGQTLKVDPAAAREQARTFARSERLRELVNAADPLFSREREDAADLVGFDIVLRDHKDAEAGSDGILRYLALIEPSREAEAARLSADIAAYVQETVSQSTTPGGPPAGAAASRSEPFNPFTMASAFPLGGALDLDALKQKAAGLVWKGVERSLTSGWKAEHRPARDRNATLQKYRNEAYPDYDAPVGAFALSKAMRTSREFMDALKILDARQASQKALADGDPKAALAALSGLERNTYAKTPCLQNQFSKVHQALGDLASADRTYAIADQSPEQTVDGFTDHVSLLVMMKRFDAASALISRAEARFGDHKPFLPSMVAMAAARKDGKAEVSAFEECMDSQVETLRRACRAALLGPNGEAKLDHLSEEDRARMERKLAQTGDKLTWQNLVKPIEAR